MADRHIFKKESAIRAIAWLSSKIDSLKDDKQYVVEVKQYRKKRSLDANAYCWVLIDKLAKYMYKSIRDPLEQKGVKEKIYRNAIKDIGGVSVTFCIQDKAVEKFCKVWESRGMGWQTETVKSKIEGCTNITAYYGSSAYDTAQMSRLIDCIVQDCKAVGIETMTPDELKRLKAGWT